VQDGTIGVIGQDGAWADDHRFHPISPNAYTGDSCTATDADGHAFNNVARDGGGAIASAVVNWGAGLQGEGCGESNAGRPEPKCPAQDLRNLNYGLLGPDAVGITFVGADGRRYSEPTNGPDGAYLIVSAPGGHQTTCVLLRNGGRGCSSGGMTSGPTLGSGVITEVRYRSGQVCRLPVPTADGVPEASCAPVGYVPGRRPAITSARVISPVSVRALPAKQYCTSGPLSLAPCKPGQTPLTGEQRSLLFEISFTARVAVSSGNSYYEYADRHPGGGAARCSGPGAGSSGTTLKKVKAGERVVFQDQVIKTCPGIVTGVVAFVPDAGAAGFASGPSPSPGHDGSLLVGTFRLTVK
jgi:hypothetical protein